MVLFIIRGLPGSGKSTLAHQFSDIICEADDYFTTLEGEYKFDRSKLPKAHEMCERNVRYYMERGEKKIAVANVFNRRFQMIPYYALAKEFGYKVFEIICNGQFKSIHNVPEADMKRMRDNWQP